MTILTHNVFVDISLYDLISIFSTNQRFKLIAYNSLFVQIGEKETKEIDFHDDFLRQFLRQSKYDVYKSLKRLQAFTKFRRQNYSFFSSVDKENLSKNPNYRCCTPLPWRCRDGCTITTFEYSKYLLRIYTEWPN